MPSSAQEKRPNEIIQLGADFSQALLSAEAIVSGNISVTATNALTDADATVTIIAGSPTLAGDVITAQVQAGSVGDIYRILFKTGQTNLTNQYEASVMLVITDAPLGDSLLIGLAELRTFLRLTDTSEDTLLLDLLAPATQYVVSRLGHGVFLRTYTEDVYLDAHDDVREIMLPHFPIHAVDSIDLRSADNQSSTLVTDTTAWAFNAAGSVWWRHSYVFVRRPAYNRIVFRAGFAKVPEDLRLVTKKIAASLYHGIGREGLSREQIGDYAWQAPQLDELPPRLVSELTDPVIESIINRYKIRDVVPTL